MSGLVIVLQRVDAVLVDAVHLIEAMGTQLFIDGDVLAGVVLHGPELADVLVGAHLVGAAAGGVQDVGGANGSAAVNQNHIQSIAVLILVSNHDDITRGVGLHTTRSVDSINVIGIIFNTQILSIFVHIEAISIIQGINSREPGIVHRQAVSTQSSIQFILNVSGGRVNTVDHIVIIAVPLCSNIIIKGKEALDRSVIAISRI